MFGVEQPVLDLFEEAPEALVPVCHVCGLHGSRIEVDGVAVPTMRAAALWAVFELGEHVKLAHPERVTR